jgi:hypothetical protein
VRLPKLLAVLGVLSLTSACNTADLSYPPLADSGDLGDGPGTNDGCLDRCNGGDSATDGAGDAADAADSASHADSGSDALSDANDAGG